MRLFYKRRAADRAVEAAALASKAAKTAPAPPPEDLTQRDPRFAELDRLLADEKRYPRRLDDQ